MQDKGDMKELKEVTWSWRDDNYAKNTVGQFCLRFITWNPGLSTRQNLQVPKWIAWAPIVALQETSKELERDLSLEGWKIVKNPDGNTAVATHGEVVPDLELVFAETKWRDDTKKKWIYDFTIARLNTQHLNRFPHSITVASVHYEANSATRNVGTSITNIQNILEKCYENWVDVIALDGNQSIYPRNDRRYSAWCEAWRTLAFEKNTRIPTLLKHKDDCVGLYITPWSPLWGHKGGHFGIFDVSNEELGLRETDQDSHRMIFLRLKLKSGGNRSAEAWRIREERRPTKRSWNWENTPSSSKVQKKW